MSAEKKICGAKNRKGTPCQRAPMENGRCYMHSGRNFNDRRGDKVPGRPIKHGLRSKYIKGKLGEVVQKNMEDADFLSLREEIALARALLAKLVEKWKDVPDKDDIKNYFLVSETLRKTNETFSKIEAHKKFSISPEDLRRAMTQVAEVLRKYVKDEEEYEQARLEISQIRI